MTLEQGYQLMGGEYEDVLQRLMNDELIYRFLGKFLSDSSYKDIFEQYEKKDFQEAFRAAHTLKGLCQNLGLHNLYQSAYIVTEALRDGEDHIEPGMLEKLKEEYQATVDVISSLVA